MKNDQHFDLDRFIEAQEGVYPQALRELQAGRKTSHWMWFVFPQIKGLGHSGMAQRYAISGLEEAEAYLAHPLLGARLRECTSAMLSHAGTSAYRILGSPDDVKFRSSMTLFQLAAPEERQFEKAIEVFFDGKADEATIGLARG